MSSSAPGAEIGERAVAPQYKALRVRRRFSLVAILFLVSGTTGLLYEVAFGKLLAYVFGATAYAVSTVLAAFMGGLALGAHLSGRFADRLRRPLAIYGVLELLVGLACATSPFALDELTAAYVALAQRAPDSLATLTVARAALTAVVVVVPTMAMGATLPVLSRAIAFGDAGGRARRLGTLYAINTFGGALGAVGSAYVILPLVGIRATMRGAALANVAIGTAAIALGTKAARDPAAADTEAPREADAPLETAPEPGAYRAWLVGLAFVSGLLVFAAEVVETHLLALLIGNSAYAFGLMLAVFLVCLAIGAAWAPRLARRFGPAALAYGLAAAALAGAVTLPVWDQLPRLFVFAGKHVTDWAPRELCRAIAALAVLAPPTLAMGTTFPLLLQNVAARSDVAARVGRLTFANTLGTIVGSLATGYAVLPHLGSQRSLRAIAVAFGCAAIALVARRDTLSYFVAKSSRGEDDFRGEDEANVSPAGPVDGPARPGERRATSWSAQRRSEHGATSATSSGARRWSRQSLVGGGRTAAQTRHPVAGTPAIRTVRKLAAIGSAVAVALGLALPAWDTGRLTNGANVYFTAGPPPDRIDFVREDVHGGVTTVTRRAAITTLYTNGKFQGDDGPEMPAQRRFAHFPSLFVGRERRALVIGLGTGTTLGTIAAYPWEHIDLAEISPAIVEAARTFFAGPSLGALGDPRVSLALNDGRNQLLIATERYDLVTIELTSVWFAGASSLYSREFYELVRARLAEGGILQQWVQLHHIRRRELATIVRTLRTVFPHTALFVGGAQGILVASERPLVASAARLDRLSSDPRIAATLAGQKLPDLFDELVASDAELDRFAHDAESDGGRIVSTDDNLYLEYATPKGNVLEYTSSLRETLTLLEAYRTADPRRRHFGP